MTTAAAGGRIRRVNPALKTPARFVGAFAGVILLGLVLYLGAAIQVYVLAWVVKILQAIFT